MAENDRYGSTYTFWLPPELWMRVAYFLPRMPEQPRWQPWVKYRALNRIFKKEIEDYYFEHWIKGSQIYLRCDEIGPPEFPESRCVILSELYTFSGFRDSEKRIAVLEGQTLDWTRPRDNLELIQIERRLKEFNEHGYHPYITFRIEHGATDLLPMDLRFRHTITRSYFTFDWRTYLSTLLHELFYVDRYEEHFRCKSQVQLATELEYRRGILEIKRLEAKVLLTRAAGTELVGCDGRLIDIRRDRRYRLGVKTGQLRPPPADSLGPIGVLENRFVRLDEEHVAGKLLSIAMDDKSPFPIKW